MTINLKSDAAVLFKINEDLKIINIELPRKLYFGQLVVKLIYSGICGSQLGEITGIKGKDKHLPHLLGHEGIGEVINVHDSVKKVKKKDLVLLHWMPSIGINSVPPLYSYKGRVINAGNLTTFNEYAVVSENKVTKLDKNKFDIKKSLLLGCTSSTAIGSLVNLAKLEKNKDIIVCGCGAVGLSIISAASFFGSKNIVAVDIEDKKLHLAKKLGANYLINIKKKKLLSEIRTRYLKGIDYFFECTGNTKNISDGYECLNSLGKLILIGVPRYKEKAEFYTLDLHLGKKIYGSKGGNFDPDVDLNFFYKIINSKIFKFNEHITKEVRLEDLNEVFFKMKNGNILGKYIINFN